MYVGGKRLRFFFKRTASSKSPLKKRYSILSPLGSGLKNINVSHILYQFNISWCIRHRYLVIQSSQEYEAAIRTKAWHSLVTTLDGVEKPILRIHFSCNEELFLEWIHSKPALPGLTPLHILISKLQHIRLCQRDNKYLAPGTRFIPVHFKFLGRCYWPRCFSYAACSCARCFKNIFTQEHKNGNYSHNPFSISFRICIKFSKYLPFRSPRHGYLLDSRRWTTANWR